MASGQHSSLIQIRPLDRLRSPLVTQIKAALPKTTFLRLSPVSPLRTF
jgi:hypothetical protein